MAYFTGKSMKNQKETKGTTKKVQTTEYYGEKFGGLAFFAFVLIYMFVSSLGSMILSSAGASDLVTKAVTSLFSVISMLCVVVIFSVERKEKILLTAYVKKFDVAYLIPAVLLGFGMLFALGFLNELVIKLVVLMGLKAPQVASIPLENPWQLILFVLLIGIIAPIEEECFFRGLLLGNLKKGTKINGILTLSLCFALYHGSAAQFLYQFIYGVFLAMLTLKAKSCFPSILSHSINNVTILILAYFKKAINHFSFTIILTGVVLMIGFALFMWLYKKKDTDEFTELPPHETEKLRTFYLPFGLFGMIICFTMLVAGLFI